MKVIKSRSVKNWGPTVQRRRISKIQRTAFNKMTFLRWFFMDIIIFHRNFLSKEKGAIHRVDFGEPPHSETTPVSLADPNDVRGHFVFKHFHFENDNLFHGVSSSRVTNLTSVLSIRSFGGKIKLIPVDENLEFPVGHPWFPLPPSLVKGKFCFRICRSASYLTFQLEIAGCRNNMCIVRFEVASVEPTPFLNSERSNAISVVTSFANSF